QLYRETKDEFIIVGCGGIFSAEDAYRKIRLGAHLLQLVTGMIFQGPQVISQIHTGLERLLARDGYTSLAEARGRDAQMLQR
ncbi:MAG: dihydroorotate dehydrogenase 2, partial [uncultured bacterium]